MSWTCRRATELTRLTCRETSVANACSDPLRAYSRTKSMSSVIISPIIWTPMRKRYKQYSRADESTNHKGCRQRHPNSSGCHNNAAKGLGRLCRVEFEFKKDYATAVS